MSIGIITHHDCLLHEMGLGHPEAPGRISSIDHQIVQDGHNIEMRFIDAPKAEREQLYRVHDPEYVDSIFAASPKHGMVALDPDTQMNTFSLDAALRAAGAVIEAVEMIHDEELKRAFCLVRPPGHHAEYARAMGFCLFNNIMVGVAHARSLGAGRIAIADFDVHHGNGSEDIVNRMDDVLLLSTFQHPFYPYSGVGTNNDKYLGVPLVAGSTGDEFRKAVQDQWLPALESFKPDWLFISAGFDAHNADPLGGLKFTEKDYAWVTRQLCDVANKHAKGRIVSSLEGGYNLDVLGKSVCAHLDVLLDD